MKASKNQQIDQNKMRVWIDEKGKQKNVKASNSESSRSPPTEASTKLEPKWVRLCRQTAQARPSSFLLAYTEGQVPQHPRNTDNLCYFHT
jgi:hypothetical protein